MSHLNSDGLEVIKVRAQTLAGNIIRQEQATTLHSWTLEIPVLHRISWEDGSAWIFKDTSPLLWEYLHGSCERSGWMPGVWPTSKMPAAFKLFLLPDDFGGLRNDYPHILP